MCSPQNMYSPVVALWLTSDGDSGIDGLRVHGGLRKRLSECRPAVQECGGHQHAAFWGQSVIHVGLIELWCPLRVWRNILLWTWIWVCHGAVEVHAELWWWRASICCRGAGRGGAGRGGAVHWRTSRLQQAGLSSGGSRWTIARFGLHTLAAADRYNRTDQHKRQEGAHHNHKGEICWYWERKEIKLN